MLPPMQQITIVEELVLLLLNEESGYLEQVSGWNLSCVLAGSALADLAFESRIDTDLQSLKVLDDTPLGDAMLDPILARIANGEPGKPAQYWIEKTASESTEILDAALERLVDRGILDRESGGFWSLSRKARVNYRSQEGGASAHVRRRVLSAILEDELPDPRDAVVTGLAHACDAFRFLLILEDYEQALPRIELVSKLDLIGRTVGEAVAECAQRQPTLMAKPAPRVGLWTVLSQPALWQGNLAKLMATLYRKYGPVFVIPKPLSRKPLMYILAGEDSNHWVNRVGRLHLRSMDYFSEMERLFGASRSLTSMDGAEHYRMRKARRAAYSRGRVEARFDDILNEIRSELNRWNKGDVLVARDACRSLLSRQSSNLSISMDTSEHLADILNYKNRALLTHVQHALPKFMVRTPKMLSNRRLIERVYVQMCSSHTPAQRQGRGRDELDDLLSLHAADPQFFPEADMKLAFIMSLIPAIYTGNALAFALFEMYSRPNLLARVKSEARVLFGNGNPRPQDFIPEAVDVSRRLFLETLRLYPPVPMQLRDAMNSFSVAGIEIPVGARVFVASTAAHYLEENFSAAESFDIDRHLPEAEAKRKRGAFAAFGVGTHTCLGSRQVEFQMLLNILVIAHHFDLEVLPSSYPVRINPIPTTAPRKTLRFRVNATRPLPQARNAPAPTEQQTGGCPLQED